MVAMNGWGSSIREPLEDKMYEIQVLMDGIVQETFRTANQKTRSVVDSEAEKLRGILEKQYPSSYLEVRVGKSFRRFYFV